MSVPPPPPLLHDRFGQRPSFPARESLLAVDPSFPSDRTCSEYSLTLPCGFLIVPAGSRTARRLRDFSSASLYCKPKPHFPDHENSSHLLLMISAIVSGLLLRVRGVL